jgi:hypothetical protein
MVCDHDAVLSVAVVPDSAVEHHVDVLAADIGDRHGRSSELGPVADKDQTFSGRSALEHFSRVRASREQLLNSQFAPPMRPCARAQV